MKTVKFDRTLVPLILRGEKKSTWRLFDDKNLSVGDEIELVNKQTLEVFGHAIINRSIEKKLGEITEADYDAHETYESQEEMLRIFRGYYGDRVTFDTIVKIIGFFYV